MVSIKIAADKPVENYVACFLLVIQLWLKGKKNEKCGYNNHKVMFQCWANKIHLVNNQGIFGGVGGCPRDAIVKALDCRIVVSKFEFQLRYYFRTNIFGKGMKPLSSQLCIK